MTAGSNDAKALLDERAVIPGEWGAVNTDESVERAVREARQVFRDAIDELDIADAKTLLLRDREAAHLDPRLQADDVIGPARDLERVLAGA